MLSDAELEECLRLLLPIIKLDAGKYLVGTKVMKILIRNNNLIARVGGGFTDLNQAINSEAKIQCLQISLQMEKKGQTFQDTMIDILREKKATEKVINKFIRDTSRIQIPFKIVVGAIKSREGRNWEQRKIEIET